MQKCLAAWITRQLGTKAPEHQDPWRSKCLGTFLPSQYVGAQSHRSHAFIPQPSQPYRTSVHRFGVAASFPDGKNPKIDAQPGQREGRKCASEAKMRICIFPQGNPILTVFSNNVLNPPVRKKPMFLKKGRVRRPIRRGQCSQPTFDRFLRE